MATSMALGGTGGMSIGLGTSSPIIGGGMPHGGSNGSIGSHGTPSHHSSGGGGGSIKFGSGASSVHSPVSTPSSTPNSTITINSVNTGSMGKCPGSVGGGGNIGNSNAANIIANNNGLAGGADLFGSKCKRKINFSNLGMPGRTHQPATVARRNARERNRVKQVNNGFAALKQHIPLGHRSKKMSKVETLRCAVDYIRNLKGMLNIHGSFNVASPAGSSVSNASGDIILMDDMDDENDDEYDQQPPMLQQQQTHHHQQQQQQMNGVNNQRDAFALSSSSSSSPPTSPDFGAAVAHLASTLHSQQQQQHHHQLVSNNNSTNQLRHMSSLSHHIHQHHQNHHATNGVSVATALLVENNNNNSSADTVTPNSNQLSPTSSDDPSSPSYASEASYVNSNSNVTIKGNGMYDYENYEPVSPEDEELLDAIAWWQQS